MRDPGGAAGKPAGPLASGGSSGASDPRRLREELREGSPFALHENVAWQERFPGLVAGVTAAGPDADFGVGTASPAARFFQAHAALTGQLGFPAGVVARQVHGARVVRVEGPLPAADAGPAGRRAVRPNGPHLYVAGRGDGLLTVHGGALLTVTAADCVPVYVVDPAARLLGLFHAGWRGAAAGVLEAGIGRAVEAGADRGRLHLHLGPAICGECYEVGPEVSEALGLGAGERGRVDLRGVLARRAASLGVAGERISRSCWCTRCGGDRFHSHRGSRGRAGRMAAYLGWRETVSG